MNRTIIKIIQNTFVRQCSYKPIRRPNLAKTNKSNAAIVQPTSIKQPNLDTKEANNNSSSTSLAKQIHAKIRATGPITVADYMREVLINPKGGYYMHRDVFGREGDFITSPEISQIFGELIAIWILSEWRKIGSPQPFQLIELGPGRGTLARDILKVFTQFKLEKNFSMHFVEISPFLSEMQAQRFCINHKPIEKNSNLPFYRCGKTGSGVEAFWYQQLESVPEQFSIILAHEFFDALPIHKLQLDAGTWKEILIDIDSNDEFRFVISNNPTPISQLFKPLDNDKRECLEYSLETDRIVSMIAERFERDGGFGLIMDYGHSGEKADTFRAFKNHALHDPLIGPGSADLTADVDFRQIKYIAEHKANVVCYGPIEQGDFIKKMEGDTRLEQLLINALPENQDRIKHGYEMLTDPKQMGKRFKFLSLFPGVLKEHLQRFPVSGFN